MKHEQSQESTARIAQDLRCGKIRTEDLFGNSSELIILHEQQEYRMRITGNGKLILTK
ncbi:MULTISPECIES: hemin uptake protein HemP [Sneathiella]